MRLIDTDALIEALDSFILDEVTDVYGDTVREILERLPTIERKTGKWIETNDGWDGTYFVCSNCGCPWTLIDGEPRDNGMNYCPNCGADMRGEE